MNPIAWDKVYIIGWYDKQGVHKEMWSLENTPMYTWFVRGGNIPLWGNPAIEGTTIENFPCSLTSKSSRVEYAVENGGAMVVGWLKEDMEF